MSAPPPFAAIWDLDGTIVDTEQNHYAAWRELLALHGRDLPYEDFRPSFGLRDDVVLVDHLGFDARLHDIQALGEQKEELFRSSLERGGARDQPGAVSLIRHLHAMDVRQAIASSAMPANIELILRLLEIGPYFDAIVSAEEVRHGKPAPDIILLSAERLGFPPSRCVVLEDVPAGIQAGKAAGARVIAIASTLPAERLGEADLIVESFEEVLWPAAAWDRFLLTGKP